VSISKYKSQNTNRLRPLGAFWGTGQDSGGEIEKALAARIPIISYNAVYRISGGLSGLSEINMGLKFIQWSGKIKMSKRGSAGLRAALFQAASMACLHEPRLLKFTTATSIIFIAKENAFDTV
jgi:hypothetical protein